MHASENPPLEQSTLQAGGEGSDPQAGDPATDLVESIDCATDAAASDVAAETPSAGALLTGARERIGLTVGEVANHLKLSVRQVEALETDAFERLPSPMFVRGFARSYARLVQIDPRPVMLALDIHFPPPAAGVVMPARAAGCGGHRFPGIRMVRAAAGSAGAAPGRRQRCAARDTAIGHGAGCAALDRGGYGGCGTRCVHRADHALA
jgi:hypothetical protein